MVRPQRMYSIECLSTGGVGDAITPSLCILHGWDYLKSQLFGGYSGQANKPVMWCCKN